MQNLVQSLKNLKLPVFIVSPNRQYFGIFKPTTPLTTLPECTPILTLNLKLGRCLHLNLSNASLASKAQ